MFDFGASLVNVTTNRLAAASAPTWYKINTRLARKQVVASVLQQCKGELRPNKNLTTCLKIFVVPALG